MAVRISITSTYLIGGQCFLVVFLRQLRYLMLIRDIHFPHFTFSLYKQRCNLLVKNIIIASRLYCWPHSQAICRTGNESTIYCLWTQE